jgi:hypothetical protein
MGGVYIKIVSVFNHMEVNDFGKIQLSVNIRI